MPDIFYGCAKCLNAEFWPVSSSTGYQVQEFFNRIACVVYQMLVKQQLNPTNISIEKTTIKTQLALNLNSVNGYISQQQSKDSCCYTV